MLRLRPRNSGSIWSGSPARRHTSKILGQLAVGLIVLMLYSGIGITALVSFAMLGTVDVWLLVYPFIFFLIAYLLTGSMMAAIGSAVNEMREAQTLMTPVTLVMMAPWLLWMPITRDPNSLFATVMSFVPPVNSLVTTLRLTSTSPPPKWQVWTSIAIGIESVYGAIWPSPHTTACPS